MRYLRDQGFQFRITPVVKYLLLINTGIFLSELIGKLLFNVTVLPLFGLTPNFFWRGALWQPATYMFLHAGIFHLLINMLILWMFGITLESTWGSRRFLIFYFICGIGAGLLNAAITPGSPVPAVGASGAIYGILMAFGILFPNQLIYIWGIFPVKAKYFVIGIGALELLTAMSTTQTGIAHFVHLGGMFFGLVYMKWNDWHRILLDRRSQGRRRQHLKIVQTRMRNKEMLQKEADKLLDKINRNGIGSLTKEEQARLHEVSRTMNELDKET